jgi:hypothetical protein
MCVELGATRGAIDVQRTGTSTAAGAGTTSADDARRLEATRIKYAHCMDERGGHACARIDRLTDACDARAAHPNATFGPRRAVELTVIACRASTELTDSSSHRWCYGLSTRVRVHQRRMSGVLRATWRSFGVSSAVEFESSSQWYDDRDRHTANARISCAHTHRATTMHPPLDAHALTRVRGRRMSTSNRLWATV